MITITCTFVHSDGTVLNTIISILAALCLNYTCIQQTLIQTLYTILPHSLDFPNTRCTHANNLHVETVKYLINKNYCNLITINIKNCTYSCLKTSSFFSRSTNKKPQVNKKSRASYHVYIRNRTLKSTVLPHAEEKGST